MQTITFLQKLGLVDLVDKLSDNVKLEEILIELDDESVVDIDVYFLANPNRTIIRANKDVKVPSSS